MESRESAKSRIDKEQKYFLGFLVIVLPCSLEKINKPI